MPPLQSRLRRLTTLPGRIARQLPLTLRGAIVGVTSLVALARLGVASVDLVVYVLGIAGVVLVLLALLAVGGTALVLARRAVPTPTGLARIEAERVVPTGFSLPSIGFLPLVDVRWEWIEPAGVEVRRVRREGRLFEQVVAGRRGQAGRIRRRVIVSDVFGLARASFVVEEPLAITIVPGLGNLKNLVLPRSISGGEDMPHPAGSPLGDRMDIRRYAPGDPARNIMWKVYARTRELNVRLPEMSLAPARRVLAYLVTGRDDEPAAAAARLAVETGALGRGFTFACDGTAGTLDDETQCVDAIARSGKIAGRTPESPGAALPALLDEAARSGAHCIVFAPASRGPWTASVERAARAHPGRVSFVLGADGVQPGPSARGLASRLLLVPEPSKGVTRPEIHALLRELDTTLRGGASVTLVDRVTGSSFPRAAIGAAGEGA